MGQCIKVVEEAPVERRKEEGKYSTLRSIRSQPVSPSSVSRSTLSKSRSKLFPSKNKDKEEEAYDEAPKTPVLGDNYKENAVEENDDEDFGSFSYDEEDFNTESEFEDNKEEEKKYSRLETLKRISRSRSRSRSPSRSLSRSRSRSQSQTKTQKVESEKRVSKRMSENMRSMERRRGHDREGEIRRGKEGSPGERGKARSREEERRYMRMGRYGGGATTEDETDGGDDDEEEEEAGRRRRLSRQSYDANFDDDEEDQRLAVHESREELDREDKPAMQVSPPFLAHHDLDQALKKTFSHMLSRMPWMSSQAETSSLSDNCSTISRQACKLV